MAVDVWGETCEESPFSPPIAELKLVARGDDERRGFVTFDIETGPLPDDQLRPMAPEFVPPPVPGPFEEGAVKLGNLKDPDKIKAKIAEARAAHRATVDGHAAEVERARSDQWRAFVGKAALDAATGRVVAIGILDDDGPRIIDCDKDEAAGLASWWRCVAVWVHDSVPIVGFNSHHFDLPFLIRRSWILGVPVPPIRSGRYWSSCFVDLMEVWQQGGRELVSLNTVARAFGMAPKVSEVGGVAVSGAEFYRVWRENRPVAEAYLKRDLEIPAALAMRMGVV